MSIDNIGGSVADDKQRTLIDVKEFAKNTRFTSTSVMPIKVVRISAHSLRWTWKIEGSTMRKPDKASNMRGWVKKIWHWKGATIILNPITLEVWTQSRPYKNVLRMIYANWGKADLAARQFSLFAQIALKPQESPHPGGLQTAHLVVQDRKFSQLLRPYAGLDSSKRVGLVFDKSHPNLAEFTGKESAEGAIGLDWWLRDFPTEHRAQMAAQAEYNKNIKLHLEVLREIKEAIKELRKR